PASSADSLPKDRRRRGPRTGTGYRSHANDTNAGGQMHPNPFLTSPFSRRRVLSLAASATALAVSGAPLRLAAQEAPVPSPIAMPPPAGTPIAGAAAAPSLPMPSTLAADASPEFRTVVEALIAAMQANQVPGAAIGLLIGDREEHATVGLASLSSVRPVT